MKKFTKEEATATALIFLVLIAVSIPNFTASKRRARDVQRKSDIGAIAEGLTSYFSDFGACPASSDDGRIVACLKPGTTPTVNKKGALSAELVPCDWGVNSLQDITPGSTEAYLKVIPVDPNNSKGVKYKYISSGRRFQIFTSLEGADEPEFDEEVNARNIDCGIRKCNMGRASSDGPVNISIEEWERQIEQARLNLK